MFQLAFLPLQWYKMRMLEDVATRAIEMVSLTLARIISLSSVFLCFAGVHSNPVNATLFDGLDQQARDILSRATPAAPHWVIYSDQFVSGTTGPPAVSAVTVCITCD